MELTDIAKSLLGEIRKLTETENVVGKPIQVGETLVIPVSKLAIGFGTGQSGAKANEGQAGGLGGGISMQPLGFLVVDGQGRSQLLSLGNGKQGAIVKAIEAVPQLVDKLVAKRAAEAEPALPTGETEPPAAKK